MPAYKPPVLTPAELTRIGEDLYGTHWRAQMCIDLDIQDSSLRYILTGDRNFHRGLTKDLLSIAEVRADEIATAIRILREKLAVRGKQTALEVAADIGRLPAGRLIGDKDPE